MQGHFDLRTLQVLTQSWVERGYCRASMWPLEYPEHLAFCKPCNMFFLFPFYCYTPDIVQLQYSKVAQYF